MKKEKYIRTVLDKLQPLTIKDNIGKERIYPEKIINSVEKVSDSIENPTLTTDHKDKEKCLDCASMDVDSDVTKPLENEANSMPAVKEGLSLTEDIEMIDTEPKEPVSYTHLTLPTILLV